MYIINYRMNWLKLTNRIINPRYINSIIIEKNQFIIELNNLKTDGFVFGVAGCLFGNNGIKPSDIYIDIKNDDYIKVVEWLNKNQLKKLIKKN